MDASDSFHAAVVRGGDARVGKECSDGVASAGVVRAAVLSNAAATALVNTVRLFLFDSDPTASTLTDAAAMVARITGPKP